MTNPPTIRPELGLDTCHGALVTKLIEGRRANPDALLIVADYYAELARELRFGRLLTASQQALSLENLLRDATRPRNLLPRPE